MAAKKKVDDAAALPPKRKVAAKRRLKPSPKVNKRPALTLLEIAEKFRRSIPPEEWDRIPRDGSINYKHYLYGHPKRTLED